MRWKSTKTMAGFFAAVLVAVSAQAVTFVDIGKYGNHKFPDEVKELKIAVTLLHKHEHDHGYLVYAEDYKTSFYRDDVSGYNACSWYLDEDGSVVAYEYCEEKIDYDMKEIEKNLRSIEEKGCEIYGTTARPIQGVVELETENGHVYRKKEELKDLQYETMVETVFGFNACDACTVFCTTVNGGKHKKDHWGTKKNSDVFEVENRNGWPVL